MQTEATRKRQAAQYRALRQMQGMSLRTAAARAHLDPAHLSRVERGEANLSVGSLYRLAGVLGLGELARLLEPHVPDGGPL